MKRLIMAAALALAVLGGTAVVPASAATIGAPHTRIVAYMHNGRQLAWVDESGGAAVTGRGRLTEFESDARWHTYTGTYHVTISALTFTADQHGWVFRFPYQRSVW